MFFVFANLFMVKLLSLFIQPDLNRQGQCCFFNYELNKKYYGHRT